MYKDELRISRKTDKQPPGSMLRACRHRGTGVLVFVPAPDAPHAHVLEGGVVLPVARHLDVPDFVQNVVEFVAEELYLCSPRRLLLNPFQLNDLACSDSQ